MAKLKSLTRKKPEMHANPKLNLDGITLAELAVIVAIALFTFPLGGRVMALVFLVYGLGLFVGKGVTHARWRQELRTKNQPDS